MVQTSEVRVGHDAADGSRYTALMAMRGMDLVAAATFLAEIGDLSRFQSPRELMAYLGLVASEDSTELASISDNF